MQNYFNYFTEIEQRFQQRRGSLLMLSTLDWALIETWREAGIPLACALRGIDDAFDKYEARAQRSTGRHRKVNGLAWCSQSVMDAVEQANEALIGAAAPAERRETESGFETERVVRYLNENAEALDTAVQASQLRPPADSTATEIAIRLRALVLGLRSESSMPLEELDRNLSVLEQRLMAALVISASEDELIALREQAARELAPYRGKMGAVQIKQVQQQFLQKRLMEARRLPRLSLFYMSHG